jgi:hypothetical protein
MGLVMNKEGNKDMGLVGSIRIRPGLHNFLSSPAHPERCLFSLSWVGLRGNKKTSETGDQKLLEQLA